MSEPLNIKTHSFHGQLRYECPHPGCAFDSYTLHGKEGVLYHLAQSHREKKSLSEPQQAFPTLFDSKGDQLQPEVPIVGGDKVDEYLKKTGLLDREIVIDDVEKSVQEAETRKPKRRKVKPKRRKVAKKSQTAVRTSEGEDNGSL